MLKMDTTGEEGTAAGGRGTHTRTHARTRARAFNYGNRKIKKVI